MLGPLLLGGTVQCEVFGKWCNPPICLGGMTYGQMLKSANQGVPSSLKGLPSSIAPSIFQ